MIPNKNTFIKPTTRSFRKRLISIFFIAITLASSAVQPANAQGADTGSDDPQRDMNNFNIWYKKNGSCGVTSGSGGGDGNCVLVGEDPDPMVKRAKQIGNFLIAKGLTVPQAAGVMGNIQAESGFRPDAVEGGNGIGFGIVQWSFGRRTALEAAAREQGVDPSDMCFQLEYLYQELTVRTADRPEYRRYNTEWEALKNMTTAREALVMFHHEFEISHLMNSPDPNAAVNNARGAFADRWLEVMQKEVPGAGAGSSPGAACASTATGNLAKALLEYAWPTDRTKTLPRSQWVDPTPAWQGVINTYPGKGRYIGGTTYPGRDCGGFVTNLIIDSGFDPNYNYRSLVADGAGNTIAQKRWLDANWKSLGRAGSFDVATLKQGDVAMSSSHTFVYVGDVPGFESKIASASWMQPDKAPMADTSQSPSDSDFTWYRKS